MTDDQTNPVPDDAENDAPLGGVTEAELDDMLSQAGELVDQLSTELGETESPTNTPVDELPSDDTSAAASLEAELAHLDQLTNTTTTEVVGASDEAAPYTERPGDGLDDLFPDGLPPPIPPEIVEQALAGPVPSKPISNEPAATQFPIEEEAKALPTDDTVPTTSEANAEPEAPQTRPIEEADTIPDFMKEFMEPEPEPDPEPEDNTDETEPDPSAATAKPEVPPLVTHATAVPVQTKPGVVGTGTLHRVVKPNANDEKPAATATGTAPQAPKRSNLIARIARNLLISVLQKLKNIGPIRPILTRMGYWICDKTVFCLEKIDAPLGGIGQRIRRLVGWLAMATLGTSVIVYVISIF